MRSIQEMIADLENSFIYETQHIPIYGGLDNGGVKYFWDTELESFIQEGYSLYGCEDAALLFAAIKCLENLVKDMEEKRPRAMLVFEDFGIENMTRVFDDIISDYRNTLGEFKLLRDPKTSGVNLEKID